MKTYLSNTPLCIPSLGIKLNEDRLIDLLATRNGLVGDKPYTLYADQHGDVYLLTDVYLWAMDKTDITLYRIVNFWDLYKTKET